MRRKMAISFALLFIQSLAAAVRADTGPDIILRSKKATALVEVVGKGTGTAFCIDAGGFFVTTQHVIADAKSTVKLILYPGEKEQKILTATVVRASKASDLALLSVEKPAGLTALELGDSQTLIETLPVLALGYPFGRQLAFVTGEYPSVTVSTGHITSLQKSQGTLARIQLDASLHPGNSGGPVVNARGQVIGIVMSGIPGSGVDFAVPVNALQEMLQQPEIQLSPLVIPFRYQHDSQVFTIRVFTFRKPPDDLSASLTLVTDGGERCTVKARPIDGHTFTVRVAPTPFDKPSKRLRLTVMDGPNQVICEVRDRNVLIGGKPHRLSEIAQIIHSHQTMLTMTDGETLLGNLSGLEAVEIQIGGVATALNLSNAAHILVQELEAAQNAVEYHVVVRQSASPMR
jgi:hypothetical protein